MAKRKKNYRRRNGGFSLPIAVIAGLAPGIGNMWYHFNNPGAHGQSNGLSAAAVEACRIYTGLDPRTGKWDFRLMMLGLGPLLLGGIVHKFVGGRLGVNRMLAAARLPVVRL